MEDFLGIKFETEGSGISRPLSEQVNMLGDMLGRVIASQAGNDMLKLTEELRLLCKAAAQEADSSRRDEAAARIRSLPPKQMLWLLRGFTAFFHLINQAEKQEIIRINRQRAAEASPEAPRAESIAAALHKVARQRSSQSLHALLRQLDIQPTLTAHPTEARRRTILYKQNAVAQLLARLQQQNLLPREREATLADIYTQIGLLMATDDVRSSEVGVADEVAYALHFCSTSIWDAVPQLYDDLARALQQHGLDADDLPMFLRYRSWVGGDRDGNPKVTPAVTRETVRQHRQAVLRRHSDELQALWHDLSLSDRKTTISAAFRASLKRDLRRGLLSSTQQQVIAHEPYRLKISVMLARLAQVAGEASDASAEDGERYSADAFLDDLLLMSKSLGEAGLSQLANSRRLRHLIVRVRTFGFHFAALDFRQHSSRHEAALAELLRKSGVEKEYAALPEPEKIRLLSAELRNPRPLTPRAARLSDDTQLMLDTFDALRDIDDADPQAIGSYIISMTDAVSDVLEVLLLAKEAGLWSLRKGKVHSRLDVVPLFETIDDLERAATLMESLFTHPIYRQHLAARGQVQEIMLGYSDSNKDGGYWMANWALHQGQATLAKVCRQHQVSCRLFHGRGGTVGRGGGRANYAILAMPAICHNGRIRFTEQGEVISFRYAQTAIAHRHLEQIVHAMLLATGTAVSDAPPFPAGAGEMMAAVAEASMAAYRELIDSEAFWPWYTEVTPIEHISRLPIASRPVSRKSGDAVDFDSLRAIPWNFAWTQTRYNVPGWYGIGSGLRAFAGDAQSKLDQLGDFYREWPFFQAIINNAQREMARARLEIARHYADLSSGPFHDRIAAEFNETRELLLAITGQQELLDHSPVIQKSIHLRNPYTDVLNLLQIELMRRWRQGDKATDRNLQHLLFLSINGIAAAMQSTG